MTKTKLLIVEDDPNLGQILKEYLEIKGFDATLSRNGVEGLAAFESDNFQLCLIDIMMPKRDGFTLASDIKSRNANIPFIFLTAKNRREDVIDGLKLGADDYIVKPFSMEELVLRIENILKRTGRQDETPSRCITFSRFQFDALTRTLYHEEAEVRLTTKEAALLHLLLMQGNKILNKSDALRKIWGDDSYFNARSMDVYIAKLRKHLKKDENLSIITEHGHGYRLVINAENS